MPGPGAFSIQPLYMTESPIYMIGFMIDDEYEAEESMCIGGTVVEEYVDLVDKTDRNVCKTSMQREFAGMAREIALDLEAQVAYQ